MPILQLPKLRADQLAIVLHPAKRKTCAMGRRYGKTVLGGVIVANILRQHGKAAWVVPTYKNSRPLWRWIKLVFQPLVMVRQASISESEQVITTSMGGFFAIYSEENIDAMRGEWFHVVVNDEAAKFREESRYDAIEPTVADSDGDIIDISTPRGRNWFYREHQLGLSDGHYRMAFHAPTSVNPMLSIRRSFEKAREVMTERSFRQEWLAEFIAESGGVFRRVTEAATAESEETGKPGSQYLFGVDFGKHNDFTVITVLDVRQRAVVKMDRFNQIDYHVQMGRLTALYERFRPAMIIAERNSMGDPLIEQLQRQGLPIWPFTTTNATKAEAIDALALAFERNDIKIIDEPVLIRELQAYEMKRLPSGTLHYGAPDGLHDDCVMSLALAWHGASQAKHQKPRSRPY